MDTNAALAGTLIQRGVILIVHPNPHAEHPKFFVVIGENDEELVGYFLINTDPSNYVKSRPDFMNMQMHIKRSDYSDFLKYDSFIACHELSKISKCMLISKIQNSEAAYRGELTNEDLERLMDNLRNSKLYSKVEKEIFFK